MLVLRKNELVKGIAGSVGELSGWSVIEGTRMVEGGVYDMGNEHDGLPPIDVSKINAWRRNKDSLHNWRSYDNMYLQQKNPNTRPKINCPDVRPVVLGISIEKEMRL